MKKINKITPLNEDFAKWYTDVIVNGSLIEYGPVKGTIIFRPNSYEIWENIQMHFNTILKKHNVRNVYLPMLIPAKLFQKEKDHVQGFAPELATITKVGEKKLSEDIFIRPTSEVIFATYFKKIIESYKDLPILNNQWVNVIRWEKTTNPFLRNSEFLWQEGHTCHSSKEEAMELTKIMINEYRDLLKNILAIDVIVGPKTESEKFSGAETTLTIEAMMKDGKALQCGTSHYFGQNFSKIYDISFKDNDNETKFVYQTSWGISTRLLGAIIMNHGDDHGIIIPPKVAPVQVDILPLYTKDDIFNIQLENEINKISKSLASFRIRIDKSDKSLGFKAAQSEIEGVPLRIEIGKRDLEQGKITIVRRDTLDKKQIDINDDLVSIINNELENLHNTLYLNSQKRIKENTQEALNYEDFKALIKEKKFVKIFLEDNLSFEEKIKTETGATPRVIQDSGKGKCIFSSKETKRCVIFARAY
ncbi:MAG: proline--tRNA ligase [Metamycoplasmataceae bacterium]